MSTNIATAKRYWAWNYRWSLADVDEVVKLARSGLHLSAIAKVMQVTVGELWSLAERNGIRIWGGAVMARFARVAGAPSTMLRMVPLPRGCATREEPPTDGSVGTGSPNRLAERALFAADRTEGGANS